MKNVKPMRDYSTIIELQKDDVANFREWVCKAESGLIECGESEIISAKVYIEDVEKMICRLEKMQNRILIRVAEQNATGNQPVIQGIVAAM